MVSKACRGLEELGDWLFVSGLLKAGNIEFAAIEALLAQWTQPVGLI